MKLTKRATGINFSRKTTLTAKATASQPASQQEEDNGWNQAQKAHSLFHSLRLSFFPYFTRPLFFSPLTLTLQFSQPTFISLPLYLLFEGNCSTLLLFSLFTIRSHCFDFLVSECACIPRSTLAVLYQPHETEDTCTRVVHIIMHSVFYTRLSSPLPPLTFQYPVCTHTMFHHIHPFVHSFIEFECCQISLPHEFFLVCHFTKQQQQLSQPIHPTNTRISHTSLPGNLCKMCACVHELLRALYDDDDDDDDNRLSF